jgi:hypothetical protein
MAEYPSLPIYETLHEELRTSFAQTDRVYAVQLVYRALHPYAAIPCSYRALLTAVQECLAHELQQLGDD